MGNIYNLKEKLIDALNYFDLAVGEMKDKDYSNAVDSFRKAKFELNEIRYWAKKCDESKIVFEIDKKLRELNLNVSFCLKRLNNKSDYSL